MINAKETQIILEKFFNECRAFWLRDIKNEGIDEREAFRRAFEWDMVEIYNFNKGCLHDMYSPSGDELDYDTIIEFFKARCHDLYGNKWEDVYDTYGVIERK